VSGGRTGLWLRPGLRLLRRPFGHAADYSANWVAFSPGAASWAWHADCERPRYLTISSQGVRARGRPLPGISNDGRPLRTRGPLRGRHPLEPARVGRPARP
jgi:hypothetical protein